MRIALVSVAAVLVGCTADFSPFEPVGEDASQSESSVFDTGALVDDGVDTAVAVDSSPPVDTGTPDTGTLDTGTPDTGTLDTGTPDTPDTGVPCTEAESKTLGGHCYFPINAQKWNNASSSCASKGAHLVTITSAAEQTLVESIRPGKKRWIGMSRSPAAPATAASYAWVTAEAVAYDNWGTGEPSGAGTCVWLAAANSWADQSCNQSTDAICERE